MKQILLTFTLTILLPNLMYAELRTIAIEVITDANNITSVSIYSDVEEEQKSDISVTDAAAILKKAQGWGSSILVVIVVTDQTPLQNYLVLLNTISENMWLDLVSLEKNKDRDMVNNILKYYKIGQYKERKEEE